LVSIPRGEDYINCNGSLRVWKEKNGTYLGKERERGERKKFREAGSIKRDVGDEGRRRGGKKIIFP
jgi:hypothetical protein